VSTPELANLLEPDKIGGFRVQVIERAIDILDALADGPRSLAEICRATSLSKATVFRLLGGLASRDLVIKDPMTNQYILGTGLLRLVPGALAGVSTMISTLARGQLERLAESTQETVALHVPVGIQRICVAEVPSPQAIRYTSSVGSRAALHVGAAGKVLLARLSEPELSKALQMLDAEMRREGRDPDEVKRSLGKIRREGWAISVAERVEGASAISIPVETSLATLALSLLGPTVRLPKARLLKLLPSLRDAGEEIATVLYVGEGRGPT
jgi:IclR family acetate operon transcriptional repressor